MVYGGEDDIASTAAWRVTAETLIYAANRVPEIADDIVNVDRAMRWGFGWEMGPFESWDAIGVRRSVERMIAEGYDVPSWVTDMLAAGVESFYTRNDSGALTQYMRAGDIETIATSTSQLFLADLKTSNTPVDRCVSATLHDMGDGALLLEFHSKMNALDEEIFSIYERALDRLDAGEFSALVVGNEDPRAFCAGANLLMILMSAQAGEWEALNTNLHRIQQLMMRAKYSPNPVVVAPHSMALGGGAEVSMHSSVTMANAELYMGLVEVGVGLIPGAGGCKEMVVRFTGNMFEGVVYDLNFFI
jgi:3-hydroxyacyl-CoA dehydrogenase